ncbi:FG-GAP-like repeat-containing protein [Rubripirellula tenax]|nr:FG-GAP-like repeat-containing protein [Rubripirellula tenax]
MEVHNEVRYSFDEATTFGHFSSVGWYVMRGLFFGMIVCVMGAVGCGKSGSTAIVPQQQEQSQDLLHAWEAATGTRNWQEAWELSPAILSQYPDDPEIAAAIARVAHELGKADVAAELLVQACRAESFQDSARVEQMFAAMLSVGQLYECMDVLEESLASQPNHHSIRRKLFELHWGTEDRPRARPHARFLVQSRQFDIELLIALVESSTRTKVEKPLMDLVARYPEDLRPLTARAKTELDRGRLGEARATLEKVLLNHPQHVPANVLLGKLQIAESNFDEFAVATARMDRNLDDYPEYWIALGDWCQSENLTEEAAKAYWEATRRDADSTDAWLKLRGVWNLIAHPETMDDVTAKAVASRSTQLNRLNQLVSEFKITGKESVSLAIDISQTLVDLGRIWEAEAWTAIATTFASGDRPGLTQTRQTIVAKLRRKTPWQLTEGHPELTVSLSTFPAPDLATRNRIATGGGRDSAQPSNDGEQATNRYVLTDESQQRGLRFFGRTGDDLDRPGIMLYQFNGCGGGTIDFDLDGWSDVYLSAAGGQPPLVDSAENSLFRNESGSFRNVTSFSGGDDKRFGQGVAIGDINEDGFPDILVMNYGPDVLLVNNGDGTFKDVSDRLGPGNSKTAWSTSGAIADLNDDGISDLVILHYTVGLDAVLYKCPSPGLDIARACTPLRFPALQDQFMQGTSVGFFEDKTSDWNAVPSIAGRGLGVTVGCFDDVAGVDVFITNDMTSNHFWTRSLQPEFKLLESGLMNGLASGDRSLAQGSMGIATGDLDRDGEVDFYVTNFAYECNTLHQRSETGLWRDQTYSAKLELPTLSLVGFGTAAIDLDNDGMLEIVLTNGHVDSFPEGDDAVPYAQPMQIFQRDKGGRYFDRTAETESEYVARKHVGRALWTIDANRDGLTDFMVTHQTEPVALMINHARDSNRWIDLRLSGTTCARDAIGAVVEVQSGDQRWTCHQTSGDGFLASDERAIRVGLGRSSEACQVTVHWPGGHVESFPSLGVDQQWLLVQGESEGFELSLPD